MNNARPSQNKIASFTFAELVVATTVLSAITVLILPALSDANAKFRAEYCVNNLKQWGVGFQLYAADWNGYLPSEGGLLFSCIGNKGHWFNAVPLYLKMAPYSSVGDSTAHFPFERLRIWACPEKNLRNARSTSGVNSVFYGMNDYLDGDNIGGPDCSHYSRHVKLSAISSPDLSVLLCDVYANNVYCDPMDTSGQTYPWQKNGQGLHQNGANFLFVDGHVAWFPVSAYWNGSNGITNNPALRWYP
jgi:prepilin-type processing-associated H-X9-DG protein